jgi:hypothetical protein
VYAPLAFISFACRLRDVGSDILVDVVELEDIVQLEVLGAEILRAFEGLETGSREDGRGGRFGFGRAGHFGGHYKVILQRRLDTRMKLKGCWESYNGNERLENYS